ncbi:uncharacterized protein LOC131343574 [Hemibagrus wyckioides]|uniref:uncharacterized protein LOC131343574 n=1 Tax=Hemibagrus wyckioides TaxID=337641 RepID=UPI00266D5C97|nr:uncharacterized protein LOC131343574 [Hemibagrus wyckioides]
MLAVSADGNRKLYRFHRKGRLLSASLFVLIYFFTHIQYLDGKHGWISHSSFLLSSDDPAFFEGVFVAEDRAVSVFVDTIQNAVKSTHGRGTCGDSQWTAARETSRRASKLDEEGMEVAVCRHGFLLKALKESCQCPACSTGAHHLPQCGMLEPMLPSVRLNGVVRTRKVQGQQLVRRWSKSTAASLDVHEWICLPCMQWGGTRRKVSVCILHFPQDMLSFHITAEQQLASEKTKLKLSLQLGILVIRLNKDWGSTYSFVPFSSQAYPSVPLKDKDKH